jgi:hypothetical protein
VKPRFCFRNSRMAFFHFGALAAALLLLLASCEKKGGEAVVLSKEHVAPALADAKELKEGQTSQEQWKIVVEMRGDLRKVNVLVKPEEWERLKAGDRVNVRYSQGKYTGTIWSSEIR